jgi:hypothetical protein
MHYSNRKQLSFLNKILFIFGTLLSIAMLTAFYLEHFVLGLLLGGSFAMMLIIIRVMHFSYVGVSLKDNAIHLRYYPLFGTERSYKSIEFPVASLKKAEVRKYFFGLKWDLRLTVRLKQGQASYPPICLSALPFEKRKLLIALFQDMLVVT